MLVQYFMIFAVCLILVKEESPVDMDTITLDPEEEVNLYFQISRQFCISPCGLYCDNIIIVIIIGLHIATQILLVIGVVGDIAFT